MNLQHLRNAIRLLPQEPYPPTQGAPLRASWAGKCARQVGYLLADAEPTPWPAKTRLTFAMGSAVHEVVQAGLQALYPLGEPEKEGGLRVTPEGAVVPALDWQPPHVGVHADFFTPGTVWEIKTIAAFGFERARGEGPLEHHVLQAGLGALALGAEFIELIYCNKNTSDLLNWVLPAEVWEKQAREEALRLARVLVSTKAGILPPRIDPARKSWQCRYCEFYDECEKDGR